MHRISHHFGKALILTGHDGELSSVFPTVDDHAKRTCRSNTCYPCVSLPPPALAVPSANLAQSAKLPRSFESSPSSSKLHSITFLFSSTTTLPLMIASIAGALALARCSRFPCHRNPSLRPSRQSPVSALPPSASAQARHRLVCPFLPAVTRSTSMAAKPTVLQHSSCHCRTTDVRHPCSLIMWL